MLPAGVCIFMEDGGGRSQFMRREIYCCDLFSGKESKISLAMACCLVEVILVPVGERSGGATPTPG